MKDKQMEKLIDACYDVMFQREAEMEELGLLNYGDSSYYIQNPDEYEKDKKICELENEVERLESRLANCIEPKFKIGQEVWVVFSSIQRFPFKCKITDFRYVYSKRKFYYSGTGETGDYDFAEQIWCETEEEAKAKLEEMKNG